MVYKFFDKKSMGSGMAGPSTLKLADELHKPVIKKFNKIKVYSQFKYIIWGVDLADMRLLSKQNKGIICLLCAIDLFSKYAFVVPFKDKKGISIINAFNKIIKQSNRKPNKIFINNQINIYCVYKLEPISSSGDDTFTIQNALFGAMQITKNADTSKYDYKGYGICFDEGGQFSHTFREGNFDHTTNARNVVMFGADMSFSKHSTNRANNIYVMVELFIQGINDTTIYAEKKF